VGFSPRSFQERTPAKAHDYVLKPSATQNAPSPEEEDWLREPYPQALQTVWSEIVSGHPVPS